MGTKVYCKIAVYSHFFKVYEVDETVVKHIKTYSGRMILYSLEKILQLVKPGLYLKKMITSLEMYIQALRTILILLK